MGLKSCEITLDNNWGAYYAGQTVSGKVELVVDTPKRIRGITILFKGDANTSWFTEESHTNNEGNQENERIELFGNEEYFKIQYYLIGGQGGEIEIPPGHHTYPFTCVLPPTLPSSFEGDYGYIRYTIKVTLDRPWKFDQETKKAFTILSPLDLNVNSRLKEPAKITLEKYFCCFCCQSGPLTCIVAVPYTGYVPGQVIPIIAEVDNISNVEVEYVKFALKKIVTYRAQTPRKEMKKDTKIISEINVGPVAANGSNTWNQPLSIPPLPPSNLTNCGLIDLDYELHIELSVTGFHTNLIDKIPIVIGTIPLALSYSPNAPPPETTVVNMPQGDFANVSPITDNSNQNLGWITNNQGSDTGIYPALPSFAASEFGTHSIQEKGDSEYVIYANNNKQYSPMYPVYSFNKTPQ